MKETLARINVNLETRQTRDLFILQSLRFKCKRCAIFCCKLGGPTLNKDDIERIKGAGHCEESFLKPRLNSDFTGSTIMRDMMKSKEDGSCVFLGFDVERKLYVCLIYDFRPILCRLYPFNFDRISHSSIVLKVIPCCRGLKNPEGELVDEDFLNNRLLDVMLEAMELS